jgi:hypothetical protein
MFVTSSLEMVRSRSWSLWIAFPAAVCILSLDALSAPPVVAGQEPELPRAFVDTTHVPSTGRTIAVPPGGNLQAALDAARPGDVVTLAAGATYRGPFVLPNKPGSGWITVRTSTPDSRLPAGIRVTPAHAALMPKLVAASGSVITTAAGAHHYRFIGLEVSPAPGASLRNLVALGSPDGSVAGLPHHMIFDRSYLHGDAVKGTRRGIALNAGTAAVIDSYLADFKEVGADSQALCGWNGPGPFKIVNNYLEAAGENVMFGGADPSIQDLVPSDIEIRGNDIAKPLDWKVGDLKYAGTPWTVKNLFELKNAQRVLIEGNLFERSWQHAQAGFAILFKSSNENGKAPWSVTQDVHFRNNIVRYSASAINISGLDSSGGQRTRRIAIRNNLFLDIGGPRWGGAGRLFQLLQGTSGVVIEYNTAFQSGGVITAEGTPHTGFVYRGNITPHGDHGVKGAGAGIGLQTLARYFPGAVFEGNVLAGQPNYGRAYPPGNYFPATLREIGFGDLDAGGYRLAASSPFKRAAPGGGALGVDLDTLESAFGRGAEPWKERPGKETSSVPGGRQ